MTKAIKLVCRNCKRSMEYERSIDPSIPATVVKIEQGRCDRCWRGDRDSETWYDAKGNEVSQRPFFECPDCGADLSAATHTLDCPQHTQLIPATSL